MSLGRAFNGHLADHHQFPFAPILGRIDSAALISPDIGEQIVPAAQLRAGAARTTNA
jgi:hypothetical protein